MKRTILTLISLAMVAIAGCALTTHNSPNGKSSDMHLLAGAIRISETSSKSEFNECLALMTASAKEGGRAMPAAEADPYCRNATTFGAPPKSGSPDQSPPRICGQNVICPDGTPDGVEKFRRPWGTWGGRWGTVGHDQRSYLFGTGTGGGGYYAGSAVDPYMADLIVQQARGESGASSGSPSAPAAPTGGPSNKGQTLQILENTRALQKMGSGLEHLEGRVDTIEKKK